ncbi:MAG: site-2 protease family protein [Candidatus Bathyarchaeota archaeon]|nr:site-2 protease family protein [Candidatus Bathyarchaeota archaeon]
MSNVSSNDYFAEPSDMIAQFEQIRVMVESEYDVEDGFVEHGIPTFHVRLREDSKEAFLRLTQRMESLRLIPVLRRIEEKVVLRAISKPSTKPSRNVINIGLFFATLGTVFLSGYLPSLNIVNALMFTGAIIAILGSHEMGHKLLADKHAVEATYPYFIPGLPPIGTFGAVIQQKSLPPNKDALFDIGFTGPVTGFIVSIIVTFIGVQLSVATSELPEGAGFIQVPLLFQLITRLFPPSGTGDWILLHPVAFAGWVGMIVTMLNLVPVGMFDGGHVARSLVGKKAHRILSYLGIILLVIIWYPMAFIALFFSFYQHPGPLDDVSELTTRRKLAAIGLIAVFVLCVVPIYSLL